MHKCRNSSDKVLLYTKNMDQNCDGTVLKFFVLFYLLVIPFNVQITIFHFGHHILKETLTYWNISTGIWKYITDLRVEGTKNVSPGERRLRGDMIGLFKHLKVFLVE